MNKLIFLTLLILATCRVHKKVFTTEQTFRMFQKFVTKYDKHYNSIEEYLARYNVFVSSLNRPKSNKSWKEGITKFADMTPQEFKKTYCNLNYNAFAKLNLRPANFVSNGEAPDELNYIEQGYLQGVKDQGSCGSCYAFSAIANLEGLYYKKMGKNKAFSEQMIVDCDTEDSGCNGGLMELTFDWVKSNGGIESEADYPYVGRKQTCKSDKSKYDADLTVTGYEKLGDPDETWSPVDEDEIKEFLYKTGPLAIALNADELMWYSSGIIDADSSECDPEGMDHAVTLVGYGTENGTPYWLVRNSWGSSWGEKGYFRMYRGKGVCGINQYITTATVA